MDDLPYSDYSSSGEDEWDCPLCMEEMDLSDQHFKPCPCGYQVCRFCWHRIRENGNGACPACRRAYTDDAVEFTPVQPEILAAADAKKKARKERKEAALRKASSTTSSVMTGGVHGSSHPASTRPVDIINSRRSIAEFRVIQRNLVYVIGISAKIAVESVLRQPEFFGQFGPILKLVVNKRGVSSTSSSASAYVTYVRKEDAARAIECVDGSVYDNRVIRATYGTTKYCSFFLRGLPCPNSGCMYLHEQGELVDSYTKEQLAVGNHHLHSFVVDSAAQSRLKRFGELPRSSTPQTAPPQGPSQQTQVATPQVAPIQAASVPVLNFIAESDGFFERISSILASDGCDLLAGMRRSSDDLFRRRRSPVVVGCERNSIATVDHPPSPAPAVILPGSSQLGGSIFVPPTRSPSPMQQQSPEPAFVFGGGRSSIDQFFSMFSSSSTTEQHQQNESDIEALMPAPPGMSESRPQSPRRPISIKTPENQPVALTQSSVSERSPERRQFSTAAVAQPAPTRPVLLKSSKTASPLNSNTGSKNVFALLQQDVASHESSPEADDTPTVVAPLTVQPPQTTGSNISTIAQIQSALAANKSQVGQLEGRLRNLIIASRKPATH